MVHHHLKILFWCNQQIWNREWYLAC